MLNKVLKEKIQEAFSAVLPITVIVLAIGVILIPMPSGTVLMFLAGAALLIIGMGLFTLGADMAMIPMGEGIGVEMTKTSKIALVIIVSFVMGVITTIAEPPLLVLARQVPSIPGIVIVLTVALGVGIYLVIGVLRTLFNIRLSALLIGFYIIVFAVTYFAPKTFVPVAFDSGGVTTGPMTVPFILAMGVGLTSLRSDKKSKEDSFGLVAVASIGPILSMLLLGIFYEPVPVEPETFPLQDAATSREAVKLFALEFPAFFWEGLITIGAVVVCFFILQLATKRYHKHQFGRIMVGFMYTLTGLTVFLTGVNVGFIPVGQLLGTQLAEAEYRWILVPLGALFGYFIVAAEPAVHVHNKMIEEISSGAITRKMMGRSLAVGMAAALALTMLRILLRIPILWILVPGYALGLLLTFFVPRIFTGIAFDAGGVCSGPLTSTFLLPFAMGTAEGVGGDLMLDAFGIVAVVAMTPLVVVQLMGLVYSFRTKAAAAAGSAVPLGEITDWGEIIVFERNQGF